MFKKKKKLLIGLFLALGAAVEMNLQSIMATIRNLKNTFFTRVTSACGNVTGCPHDLCYPKTAPQRPITGRIVSVTTYWTGPSFFSVSYSSAANKIVELGIRSYLCLKNSSPPRSSFLDTLKALHHLVSGQYALM